MSVGFVLGLLLKILNGVCNCKSSFMFSELSRVYRARTHPT